MCNINTNINFRQEILDDYIQLILATVAYLPTDIFNTAKMLWYDTAHLYCSSYIFYTSL
jgi:hypothetical protein